MSSLRTRVKDFPADVLTGIVDGVVVASAEGRIIIWNRAAEELTGITAAEALGKRVETVFSENRAVVGQIEKTLATGRSYSDYEAELAVKHGPPLPVGLVTSVLTDEGGRPTGGVPTTRDRTSD